MPATLTTDERSLVIEALAKAAGRHETQARWLIGSPSARLHDDKAAQMRKLRFRLVKQGLAPITETVS